MPGRRIPTRATQITTPLEHKLRGRLEITSAAPNAAEVGFAVYHEDLPGQASSATWHQIGVDLNTADGISSNWDTRSIPEQSRRSPAPLTIAAVGCLGLDFRSTNTASSRPGCVATSRQIATDQHRKPLPPPPESMPEAGQAACNNQNR